MDSDQVDMVESRKISRVRFHEDVPLTPVGNGTTSRQKKLGPLARRRRSGGTDGFVKTMFIFHFPILVQISYVDNLMSSLSTTGCFSPIGQVPIVHGYMQGWIKWFLPQEQGFKVNISSIDFLTQIGVLTHNVWNMVKSPILHKLILTYNNVLL